MADDMADIGMDWGYIPRGWGDLKSQVRSPGNIGAACRNRTDDLFITSERMVGLGVPQNPSFERETRGNA